MNRTKPSHLLVGAMILALFSAVMLGTGQIALASTPTVKWVDSVSGSDANSGDTEPEAYQTLQKAIDESHSGIGTDRSIINVKDGVYGVSGQTGCEGFPAAIVINNIDYLTIQAVSGHNPVVKPMVAGNVVSISIDDSDHLIIDNIDSDQTTNQFDNWHVCNADDLIVRNARFEGGEDGIDFATSFVGALIENNHFIDINTGSGDEVLDFTDGAYADVTIQDNLFENNYRQITIIPPTTGQATNFVIRRNVMNGTTSQEAVRLIGANGVTLENNVILHSHQQGLYIDSGSSNVNVWHNTFFNNGEEEIRTIVNSADIVIQNNIIHANGTSAAISASSSPLPGEDYNLIFNNGTATESSPPPAIASFGPNTITGQDPLFVNTTAGLEDLHLQPGSPGLEAGTDLGVTDDLEQNVRPRPTGSDPDLGAYEMVFDEVGPIASNVLATPNPAPVNTAVVLTANIDDTTTGESNIVSAEYSIDSGSWTPMDAQDAAFDSVAEDVTAMLPNFSALDVYEICVRGTDAAGNTGAAECTLLAIYDPDAGFVTGGGWTDSPAGAYANDASHSGKLTFGFVSKYKKNANVPTGQTHSQLQKADFDFQSIDYAWLIIAPPYAFFQGTGTINDSDSYHFLVSVAAEKFTTSFDEDRFRLQVWNEAGDVVYDNELGSGRYDNPTAVLSKGNIALHQVSAATLGSDSSIVVVGDAPAELLARLHGVGGEQEPVYLFLPSISQ